MTSKLVLSLFPGFDLLGRAFELEGYTVVRGPDKLWGGDMCNFHVSAGVFDGIIGGPPCQWASTASNIGKKYIVNEAVNLIPEFVRLFREAQPNWLVMENVMQAIKDTSIPCDWFPVRLRDWDCGGLTNRRRYFWIYPNHLILAPIRRPGKPSFSVLATSWKTRALYKDKFTRGKLYSRHSYMSTAKAAELQGWPELIPVLEGLPRSYAVPLLGNGVPKSMGLYIARATHSLMEFA